MYIGGITLFVLFILYTWTMSRIENYIIDQIAPIEQRLDEIADFIGFDEQIAEMRRDSNYDY